MELNHLRHFWAVARAGGFTNAARKIHVQQPGLSRAVRQLEKDLGVILFEREKRGVRLTKVGREIYETCERIFREVENVQTLADSERTTARGVLRFTATTEVASDLMPSILARFQAAYPEVWPMMFTGPSSAMLDEIVRGDSELGLFFHLPKKRDELAHLVVGKVPFKLVIASKHAKDRKVRGAFIGSREMDDAGTKSYPTVERIKKDIPEVKIRISSNDATARRQLAIAGVGVAILPAYMVEKDIAAGNLTELHKDEKFRFDLYMIARAGRVLPRAARLLVEEVRGALYVGKHTG